MLSTSINKGQGLVEYALIIVLLALVVILAVTLFGTTLSNTFNFISNELPKV